MIALPSLSPAFLLWLLAGAPHAAWQDPAPTPARKERPRYAVIVNAKNAIASSEADARATVKQLFLKDLTQWPSGLAAKPYGRLVGTSAYSAFVADVLKMGSAELARHWLRLKNTNGTTPPLEVDSDRLVMKYVGRTEGAFGIVEAEAVDDQKDVRVLFEF